MSEKMKSAYELAMEKLEKKDKKSPSRSTAPGKLSDEQKEAIAKVRQEFEAKLAEREILFKSERKAAGWDPEKIEKIEGVYKKDREDILTRQEEKIQQIRTGKPRVGS